MRKSTIIGLMTIVLIIFMVVIHNGNEDSIVESNAPDSTIDSNKESKIPTSLDFSSNEVGPTTTNQLFTEDDIKSAAKTVLDVFSLRNISTSNDSTDLKNFGNALASLIDPAPDSATVSEALSSFFSAPSDEATVKNIIDAAKAYKEVSNKIATLEAPNKDLINLSNDYSSGLGDLGDSLDGLVGRGGSDYKEVVEKLNDASIFIANTHLSLIDFFEDEGIEFLSSESGYIFRPGF